MSYKMKTKKLELTETELSKLTEEVSKMIANYGDQFYEEIYNIFKKLLDLKPTNKTKMVECMEKMFMGDDYSKGILVINRDSFGYNGL